MPVAALEDTARYASRSPGADRLHVPRHRLDTRPPSTTRRVPLSLLIKPTTRRPSLLDRAHSNPSIRPRGERDRRETQQLATSTRRRDGAGEPEAGVAADRVARRAAAAAVHDGGAGRQEGHLAAAGVVRAARRHAVAGVGRAGHRRARPGGAHRALDALGRRQHLALRQGPPRGVLRRRRRRRRPRARRRPRGHQRLEAARVARPRPVLPRPPHPVQALRPRRRAPAREQGDGG